MNGYAAKACGSTRQFMRCGKKADRSSLEFRDDAAHQHLGHRDIRTTSFHYVDKKKRIEVRLPLSPTLRAI